MGDERYEKGKSIALSCLGKAGEERLAKLAKIAPTHGRAILEYCYGTVWAQPHIDLKFKLFILIAVCASQGEYSGVERQVCGALNQGATEEEIIEAITTCAPYIGFPRTNGSLHAAQGVFDQWEERDDWKSI